MNRVRSGARERVSCQAMIPRKTAWTAAGVLVALFLGAGCGRDGPPAERPSALLITVDTLRADFLHSYRFPAETSPRIDALAARGVLFENAIATATVTAPTHASIMSSRYVRQHSIGAANGFTRLRGGTTLAEHFRAAGYDTAAFVSNVVLSRRIGLDRGFAVYSEDFEPAGEPRPGPGHAQRTTERVREWLAAGPRTPFFLWVHYQDPHGRYAPPPAWREALPAVPIGSNRPLPVLPEDAGPGGIPRYQAQDGLDRPWHYTRLYGGEVAYTDHWVGELVDSVEGVAGARGLVVVLTADHGESLGESGFYFQHGHATTPEQARVPLVVVAPGLEPGRREDVVSQVDVMPTLLELAGLPPDPEARGLSLVPALDRGAPLPPRLVFCDIGVEVSAYAADRYTRVRGGEHLRPAHPARRAEIVRRESETYRRRPDGGWEPGPVDPEQEQAIEAYARHSVPKAAAREPDADERERLRALGYLAP